MFKILEDTAKTDAVFRVFFFRIAVTDHAENSPSLVVPKLFLLNSHSDKADD